MILAHSLGGMVARASVLLSNYPRRHGTKGGAGAAGDNEGDQGCGVSDIIMLSTPNNRYVVQTKNRWYWDDITEDRCTRKSTLEVPFTLMHAKLFHYNPAPIWILNWLPFLHILLTHNTIYRRLLELPTARMHLWTRCIHQSTGHGQVPCTAHRSNADNQVSCATKGRDRVGRKGEGRAGRREGEK